LRLAGDGKVINIMERVLNHVDTRLMNHGKRVAYLIFKLLGKRVVSDSEMRDICVLAMLHDIGAYKTEEIDKFMVFETSDVWEHSIYGRLFLQYFSPLSELAPVIMYHHADCKEVQGLKNPAHQELAQLISLCDRADIFAQLRGDGDAFADYIQKKRNIKYSDAAVDMFLSSGINIDRVFDDIDSDAVFNRILYNTPLTEEDAEKYIKMTVFSIDFRSSQTVIHSIAVACIARLLAALSGADKAEIEEIETGAMLHDIGKVGIPVNILENPGRLNDDDMEIMRTHVDITEKIIDGCVGTAVRNIAVNHHEKPDGSGYPRGLSGGAVAFSERIVAVADIFSALYGARSYKGAYSKERIIGILRDMDAKNLLDSEIVKFSVEHFDEIAEAVDRDSAPVIAAYNDMNREYLRLRNEIKGTVL